MLREVPVAQGPRPFSFARERRLTVLRGRQWKPDRTVHVLRGDSSKAVNRHTDRAVQERSLLSKLLGVKQKLERTNEGAPPQTGMRNVTEMNSAEAAVPHPRKVSY